MCSTKHIVKLYFTGLLLVRQKLYLHRFLIEKIYKNIPCITYSYCKTTNLILFDKKEMFQNLQDYFNLVEDYPQRMRLQRRRYKVYVALYLEFMTPCNLTFFFSAKLLNKSLKDYIQGIVLNIPLEWTDFKSSGLLYSLILCGSPCIQQKSGEIDKSEELRKFRNYKSNSLPSFRNILNFFYF